MSHAQNIVGPQIKVLRREKGLTQAMLAARCGILGWDVTENIITKIETQVRCITDAEMMCLVKALNVGPEKIWPPTGALPGMIRDFFSEDRG